MAEMESKDKHGGGLIRSGVSLTEIQKPVVLSLVKCKRALFVSATGSGKTPMSIFGFAVLRKRNQADNMLVFAPKNAYEKGVWQTDIAKFSFMRCITLDEFLEKAESCTVGALLDYYDVIICKHTHCKSEAHFKALAQIIRDKTHRSLCVIDEVHTFKSPKTALTVCMRELMRYAYALWGVTATILAKNCLDTFNLFNFIKPKLFPTQYDFLATYCVTVKQVIGRKPDGSLRKVEVPVSYKDVDALLAHVAPYLVVGVDSMGIDVNIIDYEMGDEAGAYALVAHGVTDDSCTNNEEWLAKVFGVGVDGGGVRTVKELDRYSSRFIYLQSVVDGALDRSGVFTTGATSGKMDKFVGLVKKITAKNESALVYCDYYTTLDALKARLEREGIKDGRGNRIKVVESSARSGYKKGLTSAALCSAHSYIVLCSQGATESENYYYINHAICYDLGVTPKLYLQFVGRIMRATTLYQGDLHSYLFRADNIDLYKLYMVGAKMFMLKDMSYNFDSYPQQYIKAVESAEFLQIIRRHLLWSGGIGKKVKR